MIKLTIYILSFLITCEVYSQTAISSIKEYSELYKKIFTFNDWTLAFDEINRDLKINPNSINTLYFRAYAYYKIHRYELAINDLNSILLIDERNKDVLDLKADCYYMMKDYFESISLYSRILRIYPNDFEIYTDRSNAKFALGDKLGALEDSDMAVSVCKSVLSPEMGVGYNYSLGNCYTQRGHMKYETSDWEGALSDLNLALEIDTNNGKALFHRGLVMHFYKNDPIQGCRDLSKAGEHGVDSYSYIKILCND